MIFKKVSICTQENRFGFFNRVKSPHSCFVDGACITAFVREARAGGGAKFSPAALKFTIQNRLKIPKISPVALVFALEIREDHPFQSIQTSSESPRSGQNP